MYCIAFQRLLQCPRLGFSLSSFQIVVGCDLRASSTNRISSLHQLLGKYSNETFCCPCSDGSDDSCGFTSSLQLHQEHPYTQGLLHRTMLFTSLDSLLFCFGSCYVAIRLHIYYNIFCIYCLLYMYCKHTNAVDTSTNKIIRVYKSVYTVGFGFSPNISLELADRAFL